MIKKINALFGAAFIGLSMHAGYGDIFRKALEANEVYDTQIQQESKTDKQAIEGMILGAINKNDTTAAELLLRTYPMLEDDAQAVRQAQEALSQSYTALQNVLVQSKTVEKRKLTAGVDHTDSVSAETPFFNQMLGNVAYNVHADNPAIIAANKNLALLKQARAYVEHKLKSHTEYIGLGGKCPVCFDSVTDAVTPHPKTQTELQALADSQLEKSGDQSECLQLEKSEDASQSLSKNMVTTCANNHVMCVQCFYNPTISACTLCREPLSYKQHETCLQCGVGKDVGFTYCESCKTVSVTCKACTSTPCCGAVKGAVVAGHHDAIKKQVKALITRCRREEADYRKAQKEETDSRLKEYSKERFPEVKEKGDRLMVATERFKELQNKELQSRDDAIESAMLEEECFELSARLKKMLAEHGVHAEKMKTICSNNIKAFAEQKEREEEAIKKMAKDATGSDLEMLSETLAEALLARILNALHS